MIRRLGFAALALALVQVPLSSLGGAWHASAYAAEDVPMQAAGTAGEHVDQKAMQKGKHMKKSGGKRKMNKK